MTQFLRSPFGPTFQDFARQVRTDCLICSPYITGRPIQDLIGAMRNKGLSSSVRVQVITDFSAANIVRGAMDLPALISLAAQIRNVELTYLPRVHAKIYVCDDRFALVGSANFTDGASYRNWEYGVRVDDPASVRQVSMDAREYAALGTRVTSTQLQELHTQVDAFKQTFQAERQALDRKLSTLKILPASTEIERNIEDNLLGLRVKERTINGIFSETMLFLLKNGPMTADDLRDRIQEIHPDLCDVATDRVIHGQRFGRLWKHQVRTARANLKQRQQIDYDAAKRVWRRLS